MKNRDYVLPVVFDLLSDLIAMLGGTCKRQNGPLGLAGDKGYSSRENRRWLRERGIRAVIPYHSDQTNQMRAPFDALTYKQRNVVERCVGWLKEFRKIGTRYDKLAVNYLAFVKLAMIKKYFRKIDFSDRA